MEPVDTWTARIFVGFRRSDEDFVHSIADVMLLCQKYVNEVGLCVSVQKTYFIYKGNREPGAEVLLIQYPRFPKDIDVLKEYALTLGEQLRTEFGQKRVSVLFPDKTITLGKSK